MAPSTGAHVIARVLRDLGVTVIFGLVGIPVVDIAEEAINLGIRFIALRNEQSCSYAATAYGYITGRPGVCLLVGGPGILHAVAGIGNSSENAFPTLFLGGSSETYLNTRGAFQEMDAVSLLTPHTKRAIRPTSNDPSVIASAIYMAYRICWYGRPGPTFVDFPADLIMDPVNPKYPPARKLIVHDPPKPSPDPALILRAAALLRSAKSPLVILGKGSAYARAEHSIRGLINSANLPFLPTPMGKGVMPESSPLNTSSARSAALREADVILLLGARLNWILHFGAAPKFRKDVQIIQVDISPEELGRTNSIGEPSLSIFADITLTVDSFTKQLKDWKALPQPGLADSSASNPYAAKLTSSAAQNEEQSQALALAPTREHTPMTFQRAFHIIKDTLHSLSPPSDGGIVYVSEGSQTMDISRPIFPLEHPRQKLDAGTYATMGIGMAYAIAAWAAYNLPQSEVDVGGGGGRIRQSHKRKKIVALEGDSALGFSGMDIETMARLGMDVLIICMNNSGIYRGDTADPAEWKKLQTETVENKPPTTAVSPAPAAGKKHKKGLRSTSLYHEARYELLAQMVGGTGYFVRTESELAHAVHEGFKERRKVVLINVIVDPGVDRSMTETWQEARGKRSDDNERVSKL